VQFVLAGSSYTQGKCSTTVGEAIALLEAMQEMVKRGLTNVIFES
jgi:hypothetical protein